MEKYYRILDLHTTATEQEVKQAYRELVKVWHPDRFMHDVKLQKRAEEKLKEINDAYQRIVEHLNNPYTRQQSQQYQKTEKKAKPASQSPPNEPQNSWICPECLRTNDLYYLTCGCGFITNTAEIKSYKADITSTELYDSVMFNRSMNYTDRANFLARYLLIRFPNSKEADFIKQSTKSTTSPRQGICGRCGQHRATFHGEFRENISYFFRRQERTIDAELCFPCTSTVFFSLTGKTLLGTWWGIIGAFLGPIYIVSNIGWFLFNTFRFVKQRIRGAATGKTKPTKFQHFKKYSAWYIILGLFVFAIIIGNALDPERRKQTPTLDKVPSEQVANEPPQASEPSFTEPIQPLPLNGAIKKYVQNKAIAPLKIKTRDSGNHYYVKLVDWDTNKPVCTVFIRSGQSVSIHVPLGSYKLKYATGEQWFGTKFLFGPKTAYSVADEQFDFEVQGEHVSGYTVELIQQPNGNLKTSEISAEEF